MIKLPKKKYGLAKKALKDVTINTLFAESVVKNHVDGAVYTDQEDNPTAFYVVHPYSMSLLYGNTHKPSFNRNLIGYMLNHDRKTRNPEWLQAFPESWNLLISNLLADKLANAHDNLVKDDGNSILEYRRVLFEFDPNRYSRIKATFPFRDFNVIRTGRQSYKEMSGSVIPAVFWNNADHFLEQGIGFSTMVNGKTASIAFASFLHGKKLEIGIETVPQFRKSGLAMAACLHLIDYCLNYHYEPVWACNSQNTGSYNLAIALGFNKVKSLPYYRLP